MGVKIKNMETILTIIIIALMLVGAYKLGEIIDNWENKDKRKQSKNNIQ